jgi:hypothetical protein
VAAHHRLKPRRADAQCGGGLGLGERLAGRQRRQGLPLLSEFGQELLQAGGGHVGLKCKPTAVQDGKDAMPHLLRLLLGDALGE